MTNEEIDEMEAGREMDICVAEMITGQPRHGCRYDPMNRNGEPQFHFGYPHGHDFAPEYSTDDAAAWRLTEEMSTKHPEFWRLVRQEAKPGVDLRVATCRAALKATQRASP